MTSMQEFNCILCKETFDIKEDLQIHFRKHGDPKFNQSKKSRPQTETQASVAKKNVGVEMVSCDVCSEMFPTISKAITHKHKVHPDHDAKYFCPWCGKLFTMKHLYNKHLQSNHIDLEKTDDSNFHCDACDVDFFVPSAMLYHNKFFHRQDTDLPSIGQSKKLKMCPQNTVIQIYYCSFCGEEYDNKVNLHKHVGDDHSDENQSPEDVLRCPLCDAIFYHLDAYELHLTFHTTEDLYSEKNEMFEQLTEFSLETVAPVMDKVENVEPPDAETEMKAVGLDKFLELAMGNSNDNSDDNQKIKSKKHKKHKKSKKNAITLDEFLNMNKDVFGEGLDFQGVEEVPTQVVAKRLKQKKPTLSTSKTLDTSNLEKLKKQGIVIKMKSNKKPTMQNMNLVNKMLTKIPTNENKPLTQATSSEEVLSKLINQSNSQIKIVKKSSSQESIVESEQDDKTEKVTEDYINDKREPSPENIEVECDVNMPSESENDAKEDATDKDYDSIDNNNRFTKNSHDNQVDADQKDDNKTEKSPNNENVNDKDIHNYEKDEIDTLNEKSSEIYSDKPCVINSKSGDPLSTLDIDKNSVKDKTENYSEKDLKSPEHSINNSLNALKHLSHLITIKSVPSKTNSAPASPAKKCLDQQEPKVDESHYDSNFDKEDKIQSPNNEIEENEKSLSKLEHLKKISNSITIKPLPHSPQKYTNDSDHDEEIMHDKPKLNIPITNKVALPASNMDKTLPKTSKNTNNVHSVKPAIEKDVSKPSNIDLLKHLTNVTAKQVSAQKNKTIQIVNNMPNASKTNAIKNIPKKEEINTEIEIFNIDDSDDEPEVPQRFDKARSPSPKFKVSENTSKPVEKLKNIGNTTIKSINQQATAVQKNNSQTPEPKKMIHKSQHSIAEYSDDDEDDLNTLIPAKIQNMKQKQNLPNDHIRNTLKNLGKHITIKSEVLSPNPSIKSDKGQDSRDMFDHAGDSDSNSNKGVKITEMTDDNGMSDGDMAEGDRNYDSENDPVKSPRVSFSDDEDNNFDEDNDGDFDLDHQIKANTLIRPTSNITAQMLNLQNMNKNITIKPLSEKKGIAPKEIVPVPKIKLNINCERPMEAGKQLQSKNLDTSNAGHKVKNAAQVVHHQVMSQNLASCSQQNTVNKEVTVKTIQTKTVIEEITTTVTKTIKTLNQTVKQEVQSTSQNNQMMYQKVQGMKSNQVKNFQGVTVRQATPVAGTKIRGPVPMNRHPGGSTVKPCNQLVRAPNQIFPVRPTNQIVPVRPSNQLVPIRAGTNTARMCRPRMSGPRKATPSTSNNQQKPLRMSPHAVNKSKRPMEEPTGHFSCFKKPKESLIPVSDIPSFHSDQVGDGVVHYSSSQMSRSNFTSATKIVKGGKVLTSTQTKSEMSASSQHLEKLNRMSGLNIVKTSQMKQASKVEEKSGSSELSTSKRNTLEAIERLQKQGLLVKKPRLEDMNDSEHSDEDNNSYITEQPDDD